MVETKSRGYSNSGQLSEGKYSLLLNAVFQHYSKGYDCKTVIIPAKRLILGIFNRTHC